MNFDRLSEVWLWHIRIDRPSFSAMKKSMSSLFFGINDSTLCYETCVLAKSHRASYPPSVNDKSYVLDVWGSFQISTQSGMHWFVLFINDCTRLTWVILLKHKSAVFPTFQAFKNLSIMVTSKSFDLIMVVNLSTIYRF